MSKWTVVGGAGYTGATPGGASPQNPFVGNGADGVITLDGTATYTGLGITTTGSAPNLIYTLTRDIYPSTITLNASIVLITAWSRIFCAGTLTVNGHLNHDGTAGAAGVIQSQGIGGYDGPYQWTGYVTGGRSLPQIMSNIFGTAPNGAHGVPGGTGAGSAGNAGNGGELEANIALYLTHLGSLTFPTPNGAAGGAGGSVGAVAGGLGGAAGTGVTPSGCLSPPNFPNEPFVALQFQALIRNSTGGGGPGSSAFTVNSSNGGPGSGGAGAGDGTHNGGYGGASGGNGGSGEPLVVCAKSIIVGATGVISSNGGNGGNGAAGGPGAGGAAAGGGGGAGGSPGPGGCVFLLYQALANSGTVQAIAGTPGLGGAGGAGLSSNNGSAGANGTAARDGVVFQIPI